MTFEIVQRADNVRPFAVFYAWRLYGDDRDMVARFATREAAEIWVRRRDDSTARNFEDLFRGR